MKHPVKHWWPSAANLWGSGMSIPEIAKLLKVRRYGVQIALKEMRLR
jgi:hypothetical protein